MDDKPSKDAIEEAIFIEPNPILKLADLRNGKVLIIDSSEVLNADDAHRMIARLRELAEFELPSIVILDDFSTSGLADESHRVLMEMAKKLKPVEPLPAPHALDYERTDRAARRATKFARRRRLFQEPTWKPKRF